MRQSTGGQDLRIKPIVKAYMYFFYSFEGKIYQQVLLHPILFERALSKKFRELFLKVSKEEL